MSEKKITAQRVVEHMRELGPEARVLLLAGTITIADFATRGPNGILTLYGDEFTTSQPRIQLTHKAGGTVKVTTLPIVAHRGVLDGLRFSLVVFETLPTNGLTQDTCEYARQMLTIQPREWVKSTDGTYEEGTDPSNQGDA